ncbi:hypothetical protein BURKHO8Y_200038 [Burkholderia sp. 8Y]|nr:hypothetical protein BURKHO8Y_200038 [Burkholderia sp. 8Y]
MFLRDPLAKWCLIGFIGRHVVLSRSRQSYALPDTRSSLAAELCVIPARPRSRFARRTGMA